MSNLAKALVTDYADLGLALKETETSLRSLDGASLVEFEGIEDSEGASIGLKIFINGDYIESLSYEDETFNERLMKVIIEPLNF